MKDKISEKRVALLHPKIKDEVKQLIEKAESIVDDNLAIRVVQGLRTIDEQNKIFNQPHDGIDNDGDGKIDERDEFVSKAKGGASYHNYGLAIDICWLFKQPDGTYKYDESKSWKTGPNFFKVIKIFKEAGYTWGGDWKTIIDTPHFEKTFGLSWKQLYAKYQNKDFITNTQYVNI